VSSYSDRFSFAKEETHPDTEEAQDAQGLAG
jgi:hypothetical protein